MVHAQEVAFVVLTYAGVFALVGVGAFQFAMTREVWNS